MTSSRILKTYWYMDKTREQRTLLQIMFIFALLASFNQWGTDTYSFTEGLYNLFFALITVGGSFLLVDTIRRFYAIHHGFSYELQVWWYGIGFGALLTLVSGGALKLYIGPTYWIKDLPGHRIGSFPRRITTRDYALVGLVGILMHFALADLAAMGWLDFLPALAVENMVYFNLIYAALALLPIPPLDGSKIIYYFFSRSGDWYIMPALLIGILAGYGIGYYWELSVLVRYLLAIIGAGSAVAYFGQIFPHPSKK